ncbi:MAG: monovalent cation/H(+) antiporter subunit G [Acidobacteria bacterium]|nr:monovalent cation/H(+) antiporter subunit G [Acidobacteriota bacterium]
MEYVGAGLMTVGLLFMVVAAVGMVRLPDVYTRAHAVALTDSLGAVFLLAGLAAQQGFSPNALRILVVLSLLYILNPVIAHATIRAARRSGLRPWTREKP